MIEKENSPEIDKLLKELDDIVTSGIKPSQETTVSQTGGGLLLRGLEEREIPSYEKAQELIKEGRYRDAIGHLEKFLDISPSHGLTHNDLGVLYINEGNAEKALYHLKQSTILEPGNINARKNLADLYLNMGDADEGIAIYVKIMDEYPDDIETLVKLGSLCEHFGRQEGAKTFYKKALRLEPENKEIKEKLKVLSALISSKKPDKSGKKKRKK